MQINLEFIGFTIDTLGKILVAYTAIRVHHRVWKEHRIDGKVFKEMKNEQMLGIIGILMIVCGYILQVPHKI
ncbi:MAG: hypothetical protein Q8P83_00940 [bacterium]|nr:hypothetical protein [bacterium]